MEGKMIWELKKKIVKNFTEPSDGCGRMVRFLGNILETAKELGMTMMNGRIIELLVLLFP